MVKGQIRVREFLKSGDMRDDLNFWHEISWGPSANFSFFHALVDAEAFAVAENLGRLGEILAVTEVNSKVLDKVSIN